ncbi:MAG: hypothetical protein A3G33_08920 [Omnitrophica bacterium RIFCSPLOWO2_12_FULL_44_17]|uniref:HAMP domain-containing protein n=1 Tax=Candidatus Danuiimicrobium aquiferis TaxID=1801832 RepID=A0A1G1L0T6_9BACT|nr:MAG: hypothetical protein A3B72_00010 [Omnitrophica bacterium RIFCSPHIGHO2_02_FULL_45_28]OGW88988.1 MAG: hypothetical protein A3E74_02090 [Omnitrophica bacterium RIFCSPHIGHO2_12_FULL_44_12]OGW98499.1 MAG: hypothetical protein A3G33_08920 [Omnitrophica bacterium RIFCSPLOWO2_12_FULL_44_17]OGX05051.1 MAG: hypothetical protein A3J12_08795 [Omnitrophica bacterium RIFCSPLOWO2_02_FULL_44_11]
MTETIKKSRSFFSFLRNDPPQRYYVGMHFLCLSAMMVVLFVILNQEFQKFITSVDTINISAQSFKVHLGDLYSSIFVKAIMLFLVGYGVSVLVGLLFLHHVTGPMIRVRAILDALSRGQFPAGMIQFRQGDFSKEIALSLSRLIDFLSRSRTSISGEKKEDH